MNDGDRRAALRQFLRTRRERLTPSEVGLPSGRRRRTPGLRREEVAELAGTGVAWYSWLEMGRDIRVSTRMLEGVARALRLDDVERDYLFTLAGNTPPKRSAQRQPLHPHVQPILEGFDGPAYFVDSRLDVLAFNERARRLFGFVETGPGFAHNIVWRMLNDPEKRRLHVHWLDDVRHAVATFRTHYGQFIGDESFEALRAELEASSPEFRGIWSEQGVVKRMTREVLLQHPAVGQFTLQLVNFATPWDPLQNVVFGYCTSAAPTARRLARFLAGSD